MIECGTVSRTYHLLRPELEVLADVELLLLKQSCRSTVRPALAIERGSLTLQVFAANIDCVKYVRNRLGRVLQLLFVHDTLLAQPDDLKVPTQKQIEKWKQALRKALGIAHSMRRTDHDHTPSRFFRLL